MRVRVVTRFAGPYLTAEHDTATGQVRDEKGHDRLSCSLAQFLRSASRESRVHRELGWDYAVSQEIELEHDNDAGPPCGTDPA